jgi:hypothetical protein
MRFALILACCVCLLGAVACSDGDSQIVDVDLTEWAVTTPSAREMKVVTVTFDAHNRSGGMIHELAILRIKGADRENVKEIEDIDPGTSGKVTVTLKPGEYELACVIVPG